MMKADDGSVADSDTGRPATNAADTEPKEQSFIQKMCASTGLCCFKLKEQTQISALEYKIAARQKKFGVDYLTLVERKAGQAALKSCLKEALGEIAVLQTQVNDHYDKIDEKKGEGGASAPANDAPPADTKPKPRRGKPPADAENSAEGGAGGAKKGPGPKKKSVKKKKKPEGQDERFSIDE
jgi:hypothetical protein